MSTSDLDELRFRSIRVALHWLLLWGLLLYYNKDLWTVVLKIVPEPFRDHVAIMHSLTQPFLLTLELSAFVAFLWILPHLGYELVKFVFPALYQAEKKVFLYISLGLGITIFLGQFFCITLVCPLVLNIFLTFNASIAHTILDLSSLLSFILQLQLAFLCLSCLPWILYFLLWMGIVSKNQLITCRPYAYVGIFTLGMFLTPPDVIAQCLVAFPLVILFEITLWGTKFLHPQHKNKVRNEN